MEIVKRDVATCWCVWPPSWSTTLKVGPRSERLQAVSFIPPPQRPPARNAAGQRTPSQRFLGAQGYWLRGGKGRGAQPGGPQWLRQEYPAANRQRHPATHHRTRG